MLRDTLASYLSRAADVMVTDVRHDNRFDALHEQDFLDVNRFHDDLWLVRAYFHARAAENLGFAANFSAESFSVDPLSYEKAKWLNGCVQVVVLEAVFGDAGKLQSLSVDTEVSAAVGRLRAGIAKVQSRIEDFSAEENFVASTGLRSTTAAGDRPVSVSDPNVAIHAVLKNSLLSEECGLTTPWRADADQPIIGDHVLFLQSASFAQTAFPIVLQPTVFRRIGYTHPLSFADIAKPGQPVRTTNAGLAYLNDDDGSPRYRATAINAETAVIQSTVLQFNNSISNTGALVVQQGTDFKDTRDDRPPQLLADEYRGVNELESSGLTISAPTADLLTPAALGDAQRKSVWPCLFLEDFWIGFRLDLADGPNRALLSVHRQIQKITFATSSKKIRGAAEDLFAREQPARPPATNSTEIVRYIGMSSAQARDYLRFLGTAKSVPLLEGTPFQTKVVDYSGATALLFGRIYRYRLRNVFVGGISLSPEDADSLPPAGNYVQSCPFYRARAYRPGELISTAFDDAAGAGRSIFLTADAPSARVWLVPTPIDMDTARYHGVFLRQKSEERRHVHRAFVQDIQKHFGRHPSNLQYFFDPDVAEVSVRVTMLNGNPDSVARRFTYNRGAYCELVQHFQLPPVRIHYGQRGKWESFQPIEIRLSTTSERHPQITKYGRTIHIRVPPSADMEISILPQVSATELSQTAVYAASTAQLQLRALTLFASHSATIPAVVEQKLRIIHCTKAPATKPLLAGSAVQFSPGGDPILVADRAPLKETAELRGYVQVDAASTGQLRLGAAWSDIDDNPLYDQAALTAGNTTSAPRSVVFDKYSPPSGSAVARAAFAAATLFAPTTTDIADDFGLQCAENKIFLGPPSDQTAPQVGRACILNFNDPRRKHATVTAISTSRYKSHFKAPPAPAFEARSEKMLVDVPASMRLPVPDISHVVPLSRDNEKRGPEAIRTQRFYAMRIYVRRPWFLSGPGERLAIGCRAGNAPQVPMASLDKFVTQWGEDPLERPRLDVTRNGPHASDFRTPDHGTPVPLDNAFYPKRSIEGIADVLYRDNLQITDAAETKRTLSVASFALRRDPSTKLWFCDVSVAEGFVGWCGLAFFRHQPHSHDDVQLSVTPAWVYGAVLHGEQITWIRQHGKLQVTVGPVFDPNVSFELDRTDYRHGISRNLTGPARTLVSLQRYVANRQSFFEAIARADEGPWSLIKRRFGSEVASIGLAVDG